MRNRHLWLLWLFLGAMPLAGCGGSESKPAEKQLKAPSSVDVGKSFVTLPRQFGPGGIEAYWRRASRTAIPYQLAVPTEGGGSKTTPLHQGARKEIAPARGSGQTIKLGGGARPFRTVAPKSATRWIGASKKPFASTEGKVFFDEGGRHWVCSGTVLNSENRSVVWTAGHCVHEGAPPNVQENAHPGRGFHTNWAFAPAYHNGKAPYGYWRPRGDLMYTLVGWSRYGSLLYDVGAVVLDSKDGKTVFDVVGGGQGIAFNRPRNSTYWSFGYPAEKPFSGKNLYYCVSDMTGSDNPTQIRVYRGKFFKTSVAFSGPDRIEIQCNMTGGSSGGGWFADFDQTFGYVNGVNSAGDDKVMLSPYMGDAAQALWDTVRDS